MSKYNRHKRVKFESCKHNKIQNKDKIKMTEFANGRTLIVQALEKECNLTSYVRSKNNTYYDPVTKTLRTYYVSAKKSYSNLVRSLKNTVEPLLVNNFDGGDNEVFITLTFDEPMPDFYQITYFFDKWWRRLCNTYPKLELACVYVKEIQEDRNSWHIHALVKETNNKHLYIPYDVLKNTWGQGNVWINRIVQEVDYNKSEEINIEKQMNELALTLSPNLGIASVISYMCKPKSKINVFPNGSKIHGRKGKIIAPKVSKLSFEEARKTVLGNSHRVSQKTFLIKDTDDNIINRVHKEYWVTNDTETQDE